MPLPELDIEYYIITTETDSYKREVAFTVDYGDALERAKKEAFLRYKLLGIRKITEKGGKVRYGAPRLVTKSDWLRDLGEDYPS